VTAVRVLTVDDNPDQADSLAQLLRMLGHDARPCYSGAEALAMVRDFTPDAALLDLRMPEMDGYALAEALRTAAPRAVLMAISGELGAATDPRAAAFHRVFVKPPSVNDLLTALAKVGSGSTS
jgi:CheY-like chemotaxis protein